MLVPYAGKQRSGHGWSQPLDESERKSTEADRKRFKQTLKCLLESDDCSTDDMAEIILKVSPPLAREIASLIREQIPTKTMTKRQNQAKWFIQDFFEKHGISPTYSEMADALGMSRTAAFNLVHRMQDRGILRLMTNRTRSIEIIKEAA